MTQPLIQLPHAPPPESLDLAAVNLAVAKLGDGPESLIPILQAIHEHYRYLPKEALRHLCTISRITPAAVEGVATFYAQFRHRPVGRHIVRVCHGTACHVKQAAVVEESIRRHLHMTPLQETDDKGEFTIEHVGCLGCCTLAPVMQADTITYGHLSSESAPRAIAQFLAHPPNTQAHSDSLDVAHAAGAEIHIGVGSCCVAGGSQKVRESLQAAIAQLGLNVPIKPVGCVGMCHQTPLVEVIRPGQRPALYAKVTTDEVHAIVNRHFRPRGILRKITSALARSLDRAIDDQDNARLAQHAIDVRDKPVEDFLGRQLRIATEFCGALNPLDLDEYIAHDGFLALERCLPVSRRRSGDVSPALTDQQIIDQIKRSGLRGRGGAGFPTGQKWQLASTAQGDAKYIIANGDEGDPGAFMDRMILESYPYRVLEGMLIAALAIGATEGILYIRHEYPLAVKRIRAAIERCKQANLLGKNILGTPFSLDLRVMEGAGAFVCGEETALMASIEGRRGMPRLRPPFPVEKGLWNRPTCINNVETLALVPWIIRHGPDQFAKLGTATSKGTKVFALTGKIRRGGLIEVPMGVTIRQIVEEIGGGVAAEAQGRSFKAVQIGGPSGGCIPAHLADTPIDYESLRNAGAIMGSGGLVVMDDRDCMVDIARYFLQFTQAESCGKCTFCRVGTQRMLEILTKLCAGQASRDDLTRLESLCKSVSAGSLCGLGQTAPNPVLTTLRYFRDEYEAHLEGRCPAGQCKALIQYQVTDTCNGCTLCAQHCPADAIPLAPYRKHEIDTAKCTRCDVCRQICPINSIAVVSPAGTATVRER